MSPPNDPLGLLALSELELLEILTALLVIAAALAVGWVLWLWRERHPPGSDDPLNENHRENHHRFLKGEDDDEQ